MDKSCNNDNSSLGNDKIIQTESRKTAAKWYVGGTLHKSTIFEWKKSSEKNKLATCGDFIAKTVDKNTSLEIIKEKAENLKICIDEATREQKITDNEKVSKMAATCVVILGY
ncbi:hypothetical protein [Lutibacter sp.]|uniref:hypothetical protein n=1 Tax=Lutibacter sp. TaxID=1925666 RepID=UPI0025BFFB5E|nr:hypothetical protein [Lutibacter sp.]MCF6167166.1 hypothetical protein [Lutibacter sp.]